MLQANDIIKTAKSYKLTVAVPQNTSDEADAPLARMFSNWLKDGNVYSAVGDVSVETELVRSAYRIKQDPMTGKVFFERFRPKTAELYRFRSGPMEEVLAEIDKFWGLKDDYKKLGILYSRGILLYGPPGSGKTSLINQATEMITKRGDIVVYSNDIYALREGLKALRSVEPERKLVVVLEDADEHVRHDERQFLHLLDGQDSTDNILYLATTNYIENFPPRLLRSGRFDKKIEVPQPPLEGRLVYLKNKLKPNKMESDKEINRLADETEGFSFGDMLELITAVYALKEPVEKVLERLKQGAGLDKGIGKDGDAPQFMVKQVYRASTDLGDVNTPSLPKSINYAELQAKLKTAQIQQKQPMRRLTSGERNKISKQIGIITKQYHDQIPLQQLFDVLGSFNIKAVQEDGNDWSGFLMGGAECGSDGAKNQMADFDLRDKVTNAEVNSKLILMWCKMHSGKYEITAYVS